MGNSLQPSALSSAGSSAEQPDVDVLRWIESLPTKTQEKLNTWGLLSTTTASAGVSIVTHLQEYHQWLLDEGTTTQHADLTRNRIRRTLSATGANFLIDISAQGINRCRLGAEYCAWPAPVAICCNIGESASAHSVLCRETESSPQV